MCLQSNHRILNDGVYLHFLDKPEDVSLNGLVGDCELVMKQLKEYNVDKLKLIRASTSGTVESLKLVNILIAAVTVFSVVMGVLCGAIINMASKNTINPLGSGEVLFGVIIIPIIIILVLMYCSVLQRRRIGAAVFIGELADICIEEIEKSQPEGGDKFENRDKEDTQISHGTIQPPQRPSAR